MTEFEINKRVARKLGLNIVGLVESKRVMVLQHYYNHYEFDPCNNVKQAWEIMLKYGITIVFQKGKYEFATYDGEIESNHEKPLVAAMLCFLEI